jgi:putative membrane protein
VSGQSNPYSRFDKEQLILRDELALDRTVLANERTLLAYVRTALALLLAGVTFVYFSNAMWFSIVGVVSLIVGAGALALGVRRYRQMQKVLISLRGPVDYAASTDKTKNAEQTHVGDA